MYSSRFSSNMQTYRSWKPVILSDAYPLQASVCKLALSLVPACLTATLDLIKGWPRSHSTAALTVFIVHRGGVAGPLAPSNTQSFPCQPRSASKDGSWFKTKSHGRRFRSTQTSPLACAPNDQAPAIMSVPLTSDSQKQPAHMFSLTSVVASPTARRLPS